MTKKSVVIVGGGYAGSSLAAKLDEHFDVTLVDERAEFVHNVASIRAIADPAWLDRIAFPLSNLLKRGSFIQGTVITADRFGVGLQDGRSLKADFVVLATGSDYASPFKASGNDLPGFADAIRDAHRDVAAATTIAIIGAGAVGVELAGEIRHAFAGKRLHLMTADTRLFPQYPEKLHSSLISKLQAIDVKVHFGQRLDLSAYAGPHGARTIPLKGTKAIEADKVFVVAGSRPRTEFLAALPGAALETNGRIRNDSYLRPSSYPNLFAIGDAVGSGDAMTIVGASRQVAWLAKALRQIANGKDIAQLRAYKPWKSTAPILLPLGPSIGASFLPVGRNGWVLGDRATSRMKGRDLFTTRYERMFGSAVAIR